MPLLPLFNIGHVHLKVSELETAIAFYRTTLGFEVTQRVADLAAFLSVGGYHHHLGLNTFSSQGGPRPASTANGLYHVAFLYSDRAALSRAVRRVLKAGVTLTGASDHGVSEAAYFDDPDGNGIELYVDRPVQLWPRADDGSLAMGSEPLDLNDLLRFSGRIE